MMGVFLQCIYTDLFTSVIYINFCVKVGHKLWDIYLKIDQS